MAKRQESRIRRWITIQFDKCVRVHQSVCQPSSQPASQSNFELNNSLSHVAKLSVSQPTNQADSQVYAATLIRFSCSRIFAIELLKT